MAEEKKEPLSEIISKKLQKYLFLGFDPLKLDSFVQYMGDWGISRALVLSMIFIGELSVLSLLIPNLGWFAFEWFFGTLPLWLPFALYMGAVYSWVWYVQELFLASKKPVLLEMRMPREVMRSPRAMELALVSFANSSGEVTFIQRAWRGQVRPFYSLEIASFGGDIHFYIWTWADWRNVLEAAIYAQYPEVELYEVEDYAMKFRFDPEVHTTFCTDFVRSTGATKNKDDIVVSCYPIPTYVDFGLDQDPKEEYKIDPLGNILEFLGSIKPTEQIWVQIVIRKAGAHGVFRRDKENSDKEWVKAMREEIDKVRATSAVILTEASEWAIREAGAKTGERMRMEGTARPTWRHQRLVESMERNYGKFPFEFGIRGIFISETGGGTVIPAFRQLWRPVNNPQWQGQLGPKRWHNIFDMPWQDYKKIRYNLITRRFLDAYRRRMFFYDPWEMPTQIMTNEELATLWHPPSRSIATPGIGRVGATKAEPPANLPI